MNFLFLDYIIIRYNHNHIKLVTFSRRRRGGGGIVPAALCTVYSPVGCVFICLTLNLICYYIIISDEILKLSHVIFNHYSVPFKKIQNVNHVFSQIHVRVAYLFLDMPTFLTA